MYDKACLHAPSVVLSLGHPNVKASLLVGGSGRGSYCTGLLVGVVDSQLIKGNLQKIVGGEQSTI